MRAVSGHTFLPDDVELVVGEEEYVLGDRIVTHGLVTDAHLLALARRHGARLATLDRGVKALGGGSDEHVVLVPVT